MRIAGSIVDARTAVIRLALVEPLLFGCIGNDAGQQFEGTGYFG